MKIKRDKLFLNENVSKIEMMMLVLPNLQSSNNQFHI